MKITETHLRLLIREELRALSSLSGKHIMNEAAPIVAAKLYKDAWDAHSSEPSAAGLSTTQKIKYVNARYFGGATQSGARVIALGGGDRSSTFKMDGMVPMIANPAVAAATADFVVPSLVNNPIWLAASLFDPTGALSWPYFLNSWGEYSRDRSTTKALILLLSVLGVIPLLGSTFRGTRFATTGLKAVQGSERSAAMSGKLGTVTKTFWETKTTWSEFVSEFYRSGALKGIADAAKFSGDIEELYKGLMQAAKWIDGNKKLLTYLNHVFSNAKGEVLTVLIDKMGGKIINVASRTAMSASDVAEEAASAAMGA